MFKKLLSKINIFSKDSIMLPSMGRRTPKKLARVGVFHAKHPEDIRKLKKKLESSSIAFINVSALLMGTERKSFVNKLQSFCKGSKKEIYGIDRSWLVITNAKFEH